MIATSHATWRRVEQVMGLPVSIALRSPLPDSARDAAWAAVLADLREADRIFSTWRADSVVCRLDRGETALADLDPATAALVAEVLTLGEQARQESAGAFDVRRPGPGGRVVLDPSGVVKGWAVQRASAVLRDLPDTDWCLCAGGDLVCHVADDARPPWQVGVEHPHDPGRLVARIPVRSGAVATSSAAHRGDHVVDARTGRPARGVAAVTVVAPTLTWADIDATAAYALGAEALSWLRTRPGRSGLVVHDDGRAEVFRGA